MKQCSVRIVPDTARVVAAVIAVCAAPSNGCAPQPSPAESITTTSSPRGARGPARGPAESRSADADRPATGSPQPGTAADSRGAAPDGTVTAAPSAGAGFRFAPDCPGAERHDLTLRKVEQLAQRLTCASLLISRFPGTDSLDVRTAGWEVYPETPWGERAPSAAYCRFDPRMLVRVGKTVWAELDETDRACMLGYSVHVAGDDRRQVRQLNDQLRRRCRSSSMLSWLAVDFDAGGRARAVRPRSGVDVDGDSSERRCLWQVLRGQRFPCLAGSTLCQGDIVE